MTLLLLLILFTIKVNNQYLVCTIENMNIYFLRSQARKYNNKLLGKIKNTKNNLMYLQDLESWGTLEIINLSAAYIEYNLI